MLDLPANEMLKKWPDSSDGFFDAFYVCLSRSLTSEYVIRKTVAKDLSGPDPRLKI